MTSLPTIIREECGDTVCNQMQIRMYQAARNVLNFINEEMTEDARRVMIRAMRNMYIAGLENRFGD